MRGTFLGLAAVLCAGMPAVRGDELDIGCGGFVRVSGDLGGAKPDLSPVKAKLVSKSGAVRAETECAPNGYYYIPMYDEGTFDLKLEGPPGWIFSPSEVEVSSHVQGACAMGKDIDFVIAGFALAGRVLTLGADDGPPGVTMVLKKGDGQTFTTETGAGGAFSFKDAPQGKYKLTATHPKWKFKTASSDIENTLGGFEVSETFGVLGYDVSGSVSWVTGASASGVAVLLKPKDGKARPSSLPCKLSDNGAKVGAWCSAATDSGGFYTFDSVPPGEYVVVVDEQKFEVEPEAGAPVSVAHGSAVVSAALTIKSFSVGGKVIDAGGVGVAGADVLVDGKKAATSDASGAYALKTLGGTHTITASKEHMVFASLKGYEVTSQIRRIGAIMAEKYSVCGGVELESASSSGLKVTAKPVKGGQAHRATTDAAGKFCISVTPGDYKITVSGASVVVTPSDIQVSVGTGPVLDVRFGQAALHVRGKVVCLDPPCRGFEVVLEQAGKQISKSEDASFAFDNVPPGSYHVKVSKAGWCWQTESLAVGVGQEDTSSVNFVQTGFKKPIKSAQAMSIALKHSSGSKHVLDITARQDSVCLPKSGTFTLEPQQCQKLATSEVSISSASADALDLSVSHQAFIFKVIGGSDAVSFQVETGGKTSVLETSWSAGSAVATYWGSAGDVVKVAPTSPDTTVIFEPASSKVTLGGGAACPSPTLTFASKIGTKMSGKVIPDQAGVTIIAELEGGGEVARTETDSSGRYTIGPLDDKAYTLRAEKTNFVFKKEGSNFRSVQMGQITLQAVDGSGSKLAGVMLSMSGEGGYRHNNKTAADGSYTFSGMVPGDYFVKAILKEYQFAPASKQLTIEEGINPTLTILAERVAFSAFGNVKLLDGNPEKNCVMQALALDGSGTVEEGTSDVDGTFRIRGLKPKVEYSIRVSPLATRHERGSPSAISIKMSSQGDYTEGLDFMAFRRSKLIDLVGSVETDEAHLSSITVQVAAASNPGVTLQTLPLLAGNYFEFPGHARGDYVVRAASSLDTRAYKITTASVTVSLQEADLPVELTLSAEPRNGGADSVTNFNFVFLLVLVVGGYLVINHRALMPATPPKIDAAVASSYAGNLPPPDQQKKPSKKAN